MGSADNIASSSLKPYKKKYNNPILVTSKKNNQLLNLRISKKGQSRYKKL